VKSGAFDAQAAHLRGLAELALRVVDGMGGEIAELAERVVTVLDRGGKLLFCGNGGSAADAQHLATEYVVRFRRAGRPLAALALTTDTSLLTAAANDLGFEQIFARQVAALGRPGDLLILHSTSGDSPNLIAAADAARTAGVETAALLARGGGALRTRVDRALVLPTDSGAHAQEVQLAIGHIVCEFAERRLRGEA
jgi:D-sedoheptulose 7-phosphate isomerase